MTILLKQIFSFLKLLNSDKETQAISVGIVCGMFLGFSPTLSLQTLAILVIVFLFRVQIGAAFLAAAFFKLVAYPLDGIFDWAGSTFLSLELFRPFFTFLYNLPIVPLSRFYNSVVMGSGLIALILSIPVYLVSRVLISQYRQKIVTRFQETPFWKAMKASSFYQWYVKYEELRN